MCGIVGEIRFDGRRVNSSQRDYMMKTIISRGPDSSGLYEENSFFLGHRRLSVIDTSAKSNQPMIDEELRLVIIFNGVIYNFKELRTKLRKEGYSFSSNGDTEVILKSYHFYGEKCVQYFDGVFSFCIYDMKNKTFFLSRDRLGIKPLYYKLSGKAFSFSSTMKSMLDYTGREINIKALNYHFFLHSVVPAPHTLFSNIYKLEPGHSISVNNQGKISKQKYHSFSDIEMINNNNKEDIIDNIDQLLLNSIKKRLLTADVPVGILLSGGLDSSLIAAIAHKYNLCDVETFSIGFRSISREEGDEFYYSDLVSNQYSSNHKKIVISDEELIRNLDNVIECMPEPMSSQDASAFFLLAREVSKKQKVVLSGQGADELFGGYPWYKKMSESTLETDTDKFMKFYLDRDIKDYEKTIHEDFSSSEDSYDFVSSSMKNYKDKNLSFLDRLLRFDISCLIVDDPIKRVDSMTMSWGLETRVPFLDLDLVEYFLSVPSKNKIKNNGKYYLKELSKKYLESNIINRPKFHFPVPPLKILEGGVLDFVKNVLLSEACLDRGIFKSDNIKEMLKQPNSEYTKLEGNKLWHLAVFERWFQLNIDKKNPS